MKKHTILLTVSIVLILLSIVIIVLFWDYLAYEYVPSKAQLHNRNCQKISDILDELGVADDSPLRYKCKKDYTACPVNLRPGPSPSPCKGNLVITKNQHGDDCCVAPPINTTPAPETLSDHLKQFTSNETLDALMTAQIGEFILKRAAVAGVKRGVGEKSIGGVMKMLTYNPITKTYKRIPEEGPKVKKGKIFAKLNTELADDGKKVTDSMKSAASDTAETTENPLSSDTPDTSITSETTENPLSVDTAATEAEVSGEEGVTRATEQLGKETAEKAAQEAVMESTEQVSKSLVKGLTESLAVKMTEMASFASIAGVGEVLDMIMMAGMVMDIFDVGGFRQYLDNEYTIAQMRNKLEGSVIQSRKEHGMSVPQMFSLVDLGNAKVSVLTDEEPASQGFKDALKAYSSVKGYSPDIPDHPGKMFAAIYTRFIEAHDAYQHNAHSKALEELKDDEHMNEMIQHIFNGSQEIDLSNLTAKLLKGIFADDEKNRDKGIYDYMRVHMTSPIELEGFKYVVFDPDMSSHDVIAVSLNARGVDLWNSYLKGKKHLSHTPLVLISEYYRDIDDLSRDIRDGVENDPSTKDREGDLRGTKVYTLTTKKLKKPWTQSSILKSVLEIKCLHGPHLPSMASMLESMADKKICELRKTAKCEGGADGQGNPCKLNADKKGCDNSDDDGLPTGSCVYTGYIPSKCSNSEFDNNQMFCRSNGNTWTPSRCGESRAASPAPPGNLDASGRVYHENMLGKLGMDNPDGAATYVATGVAMAMIGAPGAPLADAAIASAAMDTDVSPKEYGVRFNDDTGVCTYTQDWCDRMGLDYDDMKGNSLVAPEQKLTNCTESDTQEAFESIFGKNLTRLIIHPGSVLQGIRDDLENDVGFIFGQKSTHQFFHTIGKGVEDVGDAIGHFFSRLF